MFPEKKPHHCLAFYRFREKHSTLSTTYWTHVVGVEAMRKLFANLPSKGIVVKELNIPVRPEAFGFDVKTATYWLEEYMNRCRLHLLAICAANLESFLKESARAHVACLGYVERPGKLTELGNAIGRPIIRQSKIPDMLDYAEHLFNVNYGSSKDQWKAAYKVRCMLVHTGTFSGMAKSSSAPRQSKKSTASQIPEYSWEQLKGDLHAAFEIAERTNALLGRPAFRLHEIGFELRDLKELGQIPALKDVWHYFHTLGMTLPSKRERRAIDLEFYGRSLITY